MSAISDISTVSKKCNNLQQRFERMNKLMETWSQLLYREFKVIKYGLKNIFSGNNRFMYFSKDLSSFCIKEQIHSKNAKTVKINEILKVKDGRNTKNFQRF